MAATKSAGRVSIRVVPDSTRFKEDLKKSLERIEKTMVVKIRAELELDRASLVKLKREIEALVIKIKPQIELNVSPEDLAAMKAKIEAMKPRVNVDLNTTQASRRIQSLTRTRQLDLVPNISQAALKGIGEKIMALGGFNVVGDIFKEGSEFISNLDRNALKFAKMGTTIAAAVSGIGSVLGGLVTIGADLTAMGGIGILAPAFLTGMGVGVGVLVAALKDMGTQLADLKPKFAAWQDSISKDFWSEAAGPIRKMVDTFLPILNTADSSTNTAKSLGKFFAEMANSMTEILTKDKLNLMLDRMNNSIDILRGSIRPLTNAFVNLGIVGSGYFERFSRWIVDLSTRFDNFISQAAADGRLDQWVENSITVFKQLGTVIKSTFGILKAVDRAATGAGTIGLGGFADTLTKISDTMNGERFQNSLTAFFRGVNAGFKGLVDGFIGLGPAVESFMPTFERSMGTFGDIFRKVFDIIGKFLSNKDLQTGLEKFFGGISTALDKLAPAIGPMASSLGTLFGLMGDILPNAADILATISIKLGPIFDKLLLAVKPLIGPITELVKQLIEKMAPIFDQFVTEVLPPLLDLFVQLLPLVTDLVALLTPAFVLILKGLAKALKDMADGMKAFNEWAKPGREAIEKWSETARNLKLPSFNQNLGVDLAINFGAALGINSPLARAFGFFLDDNIFVMARNLKTFTDTVEGFFKSPLNLAVNFGISMANSPLLPIFNKFLGNNLTNFANSMKPFTDGIAKLFSPEGLKTLAVEIATNLANFFKKLPDTLKIIWDTFWHKVKKDFQAAFKSIFGFGGTDNLDTPAKIIDGGGLGTPGKGRGVGATIMPMMIDEESELGWLDLFKGKLDVKFGGLFTGIGVALELFKGTWTPGWTGLLTEAETGTTNTTTNIGLTFATKFAEWGVGFDTFKTNALVSWGIWGAETLKGTQENMGGADTTITEKTTNMAATIAGWIAVNQPAWVTAFGVMRDTTAEKMGGSNDSTTTNMASIAATIATKLQEIKNNWGPGWEGVRAGLQLAWDQMTGNTRTGVQNNADEAGKLPQKAKDSIGDTRFTLVASGAALVAGFAAGMTAPSSLGLVETAAISVAAMVAKYMPHSPAEKGPLSGLGYTSHSGKALVRDFAGGMMDNMRLVRDATSKVADSASLAGSLDFADGLDASGIVVDRREVNLNVYHPVAEPTSRTIEKASNELKMAGAF